MNELDIHEVYKFEFVLQIYIKNLIAERFLIYFVGLCELGLVNQRSSTKWR